MTAVSPRHCAAPTAGRNGGNHRSPHHGGQPTADGDAVAKSPVAVAEVSPDSGFCNKAAQGLARASAAWLPTRFRLGVWGSATYLRAREAHHRHSQIDSSIWVWVAQSFDRHLNKVIREWNTRNETRLLRRGRDTGSKAPRCSAGSHRGAIHHRQVSRSPTRATCAVPGSRD